MEDLTYQPFCSGRMLEHLQQGIHDKLAMVSLLTLCGRNVIGILLASLKVWNKGKCETLLKQIQIFQAKAIMHSSRKTEQQNGLDCFLLIKHEPGTETLAKPGFRLEKFGDTAQQGRVWARQLSQVCWKATIKHVLFIHNHKCSRSEVGTQLAIFVCLKK